MLIGLNVGLYVDGCDGSGDAAALDAVRTQQMVGEKRHEGVQVGQEGLEGGASMVARGGRVDDLGVLHVVVAEDTEERPQLLGAAVQAIGAEPRN